MAVANAPVGGLYVEVKLDAKQALLGFDQLKAKGTQVIISLGAVSSGISKAIAAEVAKSEKELQKLAQTAQQTAQQVNAALAKPKTPKTPLAADLAKLRNGITASGASSSFINNLTAARDVGGLQQLQQSLRALRAEADKIRVNAVDPQDIAEADRLRAKLVGLEKAAAAGVAKINAPPKPNVPTPRPPQPPTPGGGGLRPARDEARKTQTQFQETGQAALSLASNIGGVFGALRAGNVGQAAYFLFRNIGQAFTTLSKAGPVAAAAILAVVAAGSAFIISAAAVVGSLKQIGTAGIQAGNELQSLEVSLRANLGTAGAERELGFLTERAESSVFDIAGLTAVDRTLVAYNVLNDDIRQGLLDTLITLGTVGGKSVDQLQLGAVALGQAFQSDRLLGTELLQLVNSVGVGLEVFQELPEYANKTNAELLKLREQGLLRSVDLFRALELRAASFGGVAAQAAQTVNGQLSKLREDLPASIGFQFLEAGVQDQLTNLLSTIYTFLSSIDFGPVAEGFATFFSQLSSAASGFVNSGAGAGIKLFVEGILSGVLTFASRAVAAFQAFGVALRPLLEPLQRAYEGFTLLRNAGADTGDGFNFLIDAIGFLAKNLVLGLQAVDALVDAFKALVKSGLQVGDVLSLVFGAFRKALTGDFVGAKNDLLAAGKLALQPFTDVVTEFSADTRSAFAEIDAVIADAKSLRREAQSEFESPILGRIEIPAPTGLSDEEQERLEKEVEARKKFFEDLAKKLEDARKELEELTVRWFGFRSELERGFLGDKGFEATADQIAATGRKVIEILRGVGQIAVADDVERATLRLIDLARLRDDFAEKLKEAEKKLEDAISSRDGFAKRIREQSIAFVNAFKLEEEEIENVTRIAGGGIVGYLVSKTKETKSFVASLRERVATLREFRANINLLAARGLDAGLLEQLVSAGPEQAGDVVKQLSQSGDSVLREVNTLQKEVGDLATKYGDENARRFYQAGVDTAQAQADGLKFGLKAIEFAAGQIVDTVYKQIARLADVTGAIGVQAANALASALSAGAFLGLVNVLRAAETAQRRAQVVAQVTQRTFEAASIIESEFSRRIRDANANDNPISRAVAVIAANAFRVQEYQKLNAELDRLSNSPQISVFIGQEEIDAIVRTEVGNAQRASAVNAGTRR